MNGWCSIGAYIIGILTVLFAKLFELTVLPKQVRVECPIAIRCAKIGQRCLGVREKPLFAASKTSGDAEGYDFPAVEPRARLIADAFPELRRNYVRSLRGCVTTIFD
jgi:hypothetical protein